MSNIRPHHLDWTEMLRESAIDYIRQILDPDVFSQDLSGTFRLHSNVREELLDIAAAYSEYGDITRIYIVGSVLSYQWSRRCDIDLHIWIDPESDGAYEQAIKDATADADTVMLSGTAHPVNCSIWTSAHGTEMYDGIYDVVKDGWIVGPYNISVDVNNFMSSFSQVVNQIDLDKGELTRDVIDFNRLSELSRDELSVMQGLVREKLQEIEHGVEKLVDTYDALHSLRKSEQSRQLSPDEIRSYGSRHGLPPVVIYKLLERYHYVAFLKKLKHLLSGQSELNTSDVSKLNTLLKIEQIIDELTASGSCGPYEGRGRLANKRRKRRKIGMQIV